MAVFLEAEAGPQEGQQKMEHLSKGMHLGSYRCEHPLKQLHLHLACLTQAQ